MADISIRDVRKSYGKDEVIHGVNLDIQTGEFVVILGPSGCGKSTLLRMIAGLEDITSGEITIAEKVVNHLEPRERGCAMVFQNYALYPHMTVADNIGYALKVAGMPTAERIEKVKQVASSVGLTEFLDRRPGVLSGGQRQRVAIARAFLKDAPVLILDEATSHLDAVNEQAVRQALEALMTDRTTLVIAHRLSTVRGADKIVALDQGQVIESGTHGELLARGGLYAQLVAHQLAGTAGRSAA